MKRVSILLATGFEEIEALAPLDVLRRLNYDVELISMTNSYYVKSSHGVDIKADKLFDLEIMNSNAVIIPGGLPGATNLRDDDRVISLVKKFFNDNNWIIATKVLQKICSIRSYISDIRLFSHYSGAYVTYALRYVYQSCYSL